MLNRLVREEEGQDLIEYALVATLITLAAIAFISAISTSVATIWGGVNSNVASAAS